MRDSNQDRARVGAGLIQSPPAHTRNPTAGTVAITRPTKNYLAADRILMTRFRCDYSPVLRKSPPHRSSVDPFKVTNAKVGRVKPHTQGLVAFRPPMLRNRLVRFPQ